jgi:NAD(P)-dependent dehydrogenase (short-subunit alcohol dehydrogenase family)
MLMPASLEGRIVLITGASRGIGAAVARACAAEGAQLILTAKTRGALEEVDDQIRAAGAAAATLVPLDLLNGDQVDVLGAALYERFGRLDGLVSCAADLGTLTPVSHLEPNVLTRAISVNLLANQRLIRTLETLLRAAPDARAVFAADRNRRGEAFWASYAVGKAALEALVLAWAAEMRRTTIRINLLDPGPVSTRLRAQAYPGEDPATLVRPDEVAPAFVDLLLPGCHRHGEIVNGRSVQSEAKQ